MNIKKINFNLFENKYIKNKEYYLKFLIVPFINIIKHLNNYKFLKTKHSL